MLYIYIIEYDQTGLKWKWISVKQTGIKLSPRCGISASLIHSNLAYLFGGVFDEENEEELHGIFYNDLLVLDLEKFQWHIGRYINYFDVMIKLKKVNVLLFNISNIKWKKKYKYTTSKKKTEERRTR